MKPFPRDKPSTRKRLTKWSENPILLDADVREHCAERGALKLFSSEFAPETFGNPLISLFSASDYPRRASSNLRRRAPKSFNTGGSKKKRGTIKKILAPRSAKSDFFICPQLGGRGAGGGRYFPKQCLHYGVQAYSRADEAYTDVRSSRTRKIMNKV